MIQNLSSSSDLAELTADEIVKNLNQESSEDILQSLQKHYDIVNKTQELHIEFLTEFVKNIKELKKQDKESLDNLKKQVLSHVLKSK
jgi:ATP-dependent protease HslVU (ClpYQ) ATPase subunit